MPLPWMEGHEYPGPQCWCGKRGCLETLISGTGFARDYKQVTGVALSGEDIITAMRQGEPKAVAAFERLMDRLARGMAVLINAIDPEVFVFGGGLSNVSEIYDYLPPLIEKHVFSDGWSAKLVPAQWGDSSGVRGAAYLWAQT